MFTLLHLSTCRISTCRKLGRDVYQDEVKMSREVLITKVTEI